VTDDRLGPIESQRRAGAALRPRPEQVARFAFAVAWHVLWGVLLIPGSIVAAWFGGGQQGAQDLVDGLATTFFVPVVYLVAALPLNLVLGAGCALLLDRQLLAGRLIGSALIFGLAWLVVLAVMPIADRPAGSGVDAIAALGAAAGAAYGLVLAVATGPGDTDRQPGERRPSGGAVR